MYDDEEQEPGADGNEKEEEDNEKDEVEKEENEQKNRFPEEEISYLQKKLDEMDLQAIEKWQKRRIMTIKRHFK